jgi:hypothetical protein
LNNKQFQVVFKETEMGIKMANGSKDSDLSGDENLNDSGKDS